MSKHLEIDVAKATLDVYLLRTDRPPARAQFENSPNGIEKLQKWLLRREAPGTHVCLEATGRYGDAVARTLHQKGYAVSIVNPAQIKAYGRSQFNATRRIVWMQP